VGIAPDFMVFWATPRRKNRNRRFNTGLHPPRRYPVPYARRVAVMMILSFLDSVQLM
jgi:hypothetical protein